MDSSELMIGQRWVSHTDTALGLGIVTDIDGRRVTLGFPAADEERTYAIDSAPLARIRYQPGEEIETFDGERLIVRAVEDVAGVFMYHADDGSDELKKISEVRLSSFVHFTAPQQRLFAGQFDRNGAFRLRVATLTEMDRLRESPVQGLLGARTQHLPHQLYIAHEVARRFAPRVLLADEVGLGKTIEAGLILHYQLHTQRACRVLLVVPESLIHQWLVEMLRRFNLAFSIIDQSRYDAEADFTVEGEPVPEALAGEDGNPFADEQQVLCSLDFLTRHPTACDDAVAAGWDLLVVDEAHHLAWSPESASPEYRTIESLSSVTPGLLLLTATPEQIGVASHFARLRLLDPARFHDLAEFRREEAAYGEVNAVVRDLRVRAGGPDPAQYDVLRRWLGDELDTLLTGPDPVQGIVDALLDRHGTGRVLFRNTRAAIQGFPERRIHPAPMPCPDLYAGAEQRFGLAGLTPEAGQHDDDWLAHDPRVSWLEQTLIDLRPAKVVVICARAETAVALEMHLQLRAGIRSAAFHEHLSLIERDRAAAYFGEGGQGAQALICSEIGSEGRNFQFAHHLVLFDLPANPDLLEQRIGRLDRIGQADVIDLHVPYLKDTAQAIQFQWFHEGLNAFAESNSVGVAVLEAVEHQWQSALDGDQAGLEKLIRATEIEATRLRDVLRNGRDALIELNSCRQEEAMKLIEQIEQEEADDGVKTYMTEAFDIFGVDVEYHSDHADVLRPGEHMLTGHFPGLPDDGITVTWQRQQALEREDLAFMSWEHPMVTGVMETVISSELGKAALASLSVKSLPAGTLLLEALFSVHCPAPSSLQLSRCLPLSPLRLLVDVNGRNLSEALPHDRLNDLCSNIRRRTAQAIVPQIRADVETMVDHAEGYAEHHLEPLRQAALARLRTLFEPEIRRLEALSQTNPAIRREEIDFFRNQLAAGEAAVERASMALEGIRVVVTA